jgi:hypothetical protein
MPFVATTAFFPPPAFDFLNPNPLATIVGPLSALHLEGSKHEGMFVAVVGDAFADDETGIANRGRGREDLEVALRKIAQRVEIEHLVFRVKERVRRVVVGGGGSDDHPEGVSAPAAGDAVGGAGISPERSQIGDAKGGLRVDSAETEEEEEYCGETGFVFRVHNNGSS